MIVKLGQLILWEWVAYGWRWEQQQKINNGCLMFSDWNSLSPKCLRSNLHPFRTIRHFHGQQIVLIDTHLSSTTLFFAMVTLTTTSFSVSPTSSTTKRYKITSTANSLATIAYFILTNISFKYNGPQKTLLLKVWLDQNSQWSSWGAASLYQTHTG